ncbi:MAG: patatin-like phospholipase family protein [Anaerolineae bacterium]|jgi:NTE family protein
MKAFVLGGGGAKGALQVGALRALLEAGLQPDLLAGTSVGAVNATYVAAHGFSLDTLEGLAEAWHNAAENDLLPDNYLWLTLRTLFNRPGLDARGRLREFFVRHGLRPDLRFSDLQGVRLIVVAADLWAGRAVLYGTDPDQLVLDGLLASTAIPPWVRPLDDGDRLLMDGGTVSNLPIEPALSQGATQIVALDLADPRPVGPVAGGFGPFLFHLIYTVEQRHAYLEKQLAAARGVLVHHIPLQSAMPMAVWEFKRAVPLLDRGYELMRDYLETHPELASLA